MRNAGFNNVWENFVVEFLDSDWDSAMSKVSSLEKVASDDEFHQGQNDAIDYIVGLNSNTDVKQWYSHLKEANMPEDELLNTALAGPQSTEKKEMNAFEMGKYAALEEIAEYAAEGFGFTDCAEVIGNTLNQELDKHASEQDEDFRLGVESACHQFLKEAADTYGYYDVSESTDHDVLVHILEKIAEEEEGRMARAKQKARNAAGAIRRNKGKVLGAAAGLAVAGDAARRARAQHGYTQALGGSGMRGVTETIKQTAKNTPGAYKEYAQSAVDRIKNLGKKD